MQLADIDYGTLTLRITFLHLITFDMKILVLLLTL
jgi:hypothetical protein